MGLLSHVIRRLADLTRQGILAKNASGFSRDNLRGHDGDAYV